MIDKRKYIKLLNGTSKDTNGNNTIFELMKYIQTNKPKSLFHYRRCSEYTIEAFRENKIYFNTANNFNDPYDCLVYCDIDAISRNITNMIEFPNIQRLQRNINSTEFLNTKPVQMPQEKAEQLIETLKGKDLQIIVDSIPKESWGALASILKDTVKELATSYKNYYQTEMPLVCLSEKYNNVLMWAHYADNHKGFVIEYDSNTLKTDCMQCPQGKDFTTCPEWKQVMLLPILYTNQRYDATQYIYDNTLIKIFNMTGIKNVWQLKDDFAQYKINIFKQKSWAYEKEWRLQLYKTNRDNFIKAKPAAIYLGCRISKCYEDILVKYAQEQHIRIYKMNENSSNLKYSLTKAIYKL
ncbi:MAG: DUF2971 domain-containing protein [Clostridia bacterium]|nr:DUF2971 domain-containing protein [Clostridia bacterium]